MAKVAQRRRQQLAYGLIIGFVLFTAGFILIHGGSVLNYAFPVLATAVAGILIFMQPNVYCAFVLWIWFFTPLVRRLVDYQTSYHSISPVMVAPLLVTGFTLVELARKPRFILRRDMMPVLLILLVLFYGFIVGVFTNGLVESGFEFASWLLPLTFSIFLMMRFRDFTEVRNSLVFANLLGLLLLASYGLYQFYKMPPWDAYWIEASKFTTAGTAEAEQIRLFGTLNSPGPYAIVLMGSLVLVFVSKGPLRIAAGAVGFTAFGLALVRSAWGGWVLAIAYVLLRSKSKTRVRVGLVLIVLALVSIPLVTVGPVADRLSQRFATLQNLQQDTSYQARQHEYEENTLTVLSNPIGGGFGQVGSSTKLSQGGAVVFDSGILQLPLEFGWVGTLLFIWASAVLVFRVVSATFRSKDPLAVGGAGLFMAMLAQNIFSSPFDGVQGIVTWLGLAFALGAAPVRQVAVSKTAALEPIRRLA